jgi:hypothetical protein
MGDKGGEKKGRIRNKEGFIYGSLYCDMTASWQQ